jgi:hypothetical protein
MCNAKIQIYATNLLELQTENPDESNTPDGEKVINK